MRIAQVAPLAESVPPEGYGGTERLVSYLTEELVRLGHEVTLFATADSETSAESGDYLLFLGRICPEKGPDRAIRIATRAGVPLRIAAKVDEADQKYFETSVRPLLDDPLVDFLGEVGGEEKLQLLAHARALLFPIDWPEPFGLVMIESLACGTPVVARRRRSVPEILLSCARAGPPSLPSRLRTPLHGHVRSEHDGEADDRGRGASGCRDAAVRA
jgi:Glycosyl transferases group 1